MACRLTTKRSNIFRLQSDHVGHYHKTVENKYLPVETIFKLPSRFLFSLFFRFGRTSGVFPQQHGELRWPFLYSPSYCRPLGLFGSSAAIHHHWASPHFSKRPTVTPPCLRNDWTTFWGVVDNRHFAENTELPRGASIKQPESPLCSTFPGCFLPLSLAYFSLSSFSIFSGTRVATLKSVVQYFFSPNLQVFYPCT